MIFLAFYDPFVECKFIVPEIAFSRFDLRQYCNPSARVTIDYHWLTIWTFLFGWKWNEYVEVAQRRPSQLSRQTWRRGEATWITSSFAKAEEIVNIKIDYEIRDLLLCKHTRERNEIEFMSCGLEAKKKSTMTKTLTRIDEEEKNNWWEASHTAEKKGLISSCWLLIVSRREHARTVEWKKNVGISPLALPGWCVNHRQTYIIIFSRMFRQWLVGSMALSIVNRFAGENNGVGGTDTKWMWAWSKAPKNKIKTKSKSRRQKPNKKKCWNKFDTNGGRLRN